MDHSKGEFEMKNKILLVDDDPLILSSLRRLLQKKLRDLICEQWKGGVATDQEKRALFTCHIRLHDAGNERQ